MLSTTQPVYCPARLRFCRELSLILFAMLAFWGFPYIARQIDITAAAIDFGALSGIIMALLAFLVFKAVTWGLIKAIWPVLAEYSNSHFSREFLSLTHLQKVLIYLGFYLLILYGFVLTFGAVV